ncbi:MAG: ATP-binding protein [Candidatus Hadarchaeales archaeon]
MSEFNPESFIQEKVEWLRKEIGEERAVVAVSGGVDSMTTAVLGSKAVGRQLLAIFLDDGLMREGEEKQVTGILRKLGVEVKAEKVADEFFKALRGKTDPEEKRVAFREAFYSCLSRLVQKNKASILLQGTIAADVVETKGKIKTQHNVLEQIGINPLEKYGYRVLEPLKELYKPQVREVARKLGLPPEVTERRPFPGPGLAVRVLGEVTRERVELVRKATKIVEEETKNIPCFQAFAVLMEDQATGVVKGKRRYGPIVTVRVVASEDAMKAQAVQLPWDVLERITQRIVSELPVVRVLYDLTPKPPATIEFE